MPAAETPRPGKLFVIGGGLRPDDAAVFQAMIDAAGGTRQARFVVFPTASHSLNSAARFAKTLEHYGVPADRVAAADLRLENAERQASSPELVALLRRSNAVYFTGGDQTRITRSLLKPDGTPTLVLAALMELWRRGGVVAGSSAGAAVQSSYMLSAAGLPDDAIDEGMDALDFGIRNDIKQRGLLVAQGLGFFREGIVDQHFSQYRGRLGRLARALTKTHVRFGFGVDENTAMVVSQSGEVEVEGYGNLTIVDAKDAKCSDGPLGCRISGVKLSLLQKGDRFDPSTGRITVRPKKRPIGEGTQDYAGSPLITDMAAPGAVPWAMTFGLAENASRKQEGIELSYNGRFAHGYCFTLAKTPQTVAYGGYVDNFFSHTLEGVVLDIRPIVAARHDPQDLLPTDLPAGPAGEALKSVWFRGILLADDHRRLRPAEPISRGDFACALAQTVHLSVPRRMPAKIADVAASGDEAEDIEEVVQAGLLKLDGNGHFRPGQAATRLEAARALSRLELQEATEDRPTGEKAPADTAKLSADDRAAIMESVHAGLVGLSHGNTFEPGRTFTRQDAAAALYRLIGFPWENRALR